MSRAAMIASVLLLAIAGCSAIATIPDDAFQAEADAVALMAFAGFPDEPATEDSSPVPDRKVGDKCDNCGGSGRSGDGLGKCRVCAGDGRIDREDIRSESIAPAPKSAAVAGLPAPVPDDVMRIEVNIPTGYSEGWLVDWWIKQRPVLAAAIPDAEIVPIKGESDEPWIKVCGSKTCASIYAKVTNEEFLSIAKKVNQ